MVRVQGSRFIDAQGRTLLLRGVNLAGSSKVPRTPDGATWRTAGLFEHRDVSFVGRPFALADADAHLARLARWGLDTLRLLTTWEALEHQGPRQYDAAYLEYLEAVVRKAGEHGHRVFIDFHQDVWSRFTGGDGAPGWTLEAAGFQLEHLHETGAAVVHGLHQGPLPRMLWPSNAGRLGAATMFTLFFAGDAFAPRCRIGGESAQAYLQEHFLGAVEQVVRRLRGVPCVFGYDVLNEPSPGYVGCADLERPFGLEVGPRPSPLEAMALGAGQTRQVGDWTRGVLGPRVQRKVTVNPRGLRAWRAGADCVWRAEGVWEPGPGGAPRLLRPRHFAERDGRPVDFTADFYRPFLEAAARRIHALAPEAVVFLESVPQRPGPDWAPAASGPVAYAPHWYDGVVLFLKDFHPFLGVDFQTERPIFWAGRIRKAYAEQLSGFARHAEERMGGVPVLIGELGVPFDLRGGEAFGTGDFSRVARALDRTMVAVEDSLSSACLWNYTPDNTNARGDGWNEEDLSLFSVDQQTDPADPDSGGRALDAAVRPWPLAVAGTPLRCAFDRRTRAFEFDFRPDPMLAAPTELFVPRLQYPGGVQVRAPGRHVLDLAAQRLHYFPDDPGRDQRLTLTPA